MTKTMITYRTTDQKHNKYVIVPTLWVSDLVYWLTLSESAEIVATTHNVDDGLVLPISWPSYQPCLDYTRTVRCMEVR